MEEGKALSLVLHGYYAFQKYRRAKPGNLLLLMPWIIGDKITISLRFLFLSLNLKENVTMCEDTCCDIK